MSCLLTKTLVLKVVVKVVVVSETPSNSSNRYCTVDIYFNQFLIKTFI